MGVPALNGWFDEWRGYAPLWLSRGGMATKWWACLDSNQGQCSPILESILPDYAAAMLQALSEGHLDDLTRMLELLLSIGGEAI